MDIVPRLIFFGVSAGYFGSVMCGNKKGQKLRGYTIEWTKVNGEVKIIKI